MHNHGYGHTVRIQTLVYMHGAAENKHIFNKALFYETSI